MGRPLIFLYPGQSSRHAEMFDRLSSISKDTAAKMLDEVQGRLGRELDREFCSNKDTQLGVFSVNHAYLSLVRDAGLEPAASAGLSLGEYNHLVEIGSLEISAAFDLIAARGEVYDNGPEGVMAALQPLSASDAEIIIEELRGKYGWSASDLAVSNDNSPGQCVVAGSSDAVSRFSAIASDRCYAVATVIETRIPMHSSRFKPVADTFSNFLDKAPWKKACKDYWPNVTAEPVDNADGSIISASLRRHVAEKVLWRQTIDAMNAQYPDAVFLEVGPRNVLRNMLTRRWIGKDRVFSVDDGSSSFSEIILQIGGLCARC